MEITLIAALNRDRIIGSESGGIPWDLPRDKTHFRTYSANKPILVGRRTFDEMRGWFTTQHPIFVVSGSPHFVPHTSAHVNATTGEAIAHAESLSCPELVVAGGAKVYRSALPHATKLVLTWVESKSPSVPSPIYFPNFDSSRWPLIHTEHWSPDENNTSPMTLEIRKRQPPDSSTFLRESTS